MSSTSTAALLAVLNNPSSEHRIEAIAALAEIKDPKSVPSLIMALRDGNGEVRERAAFALSAIRHPVAIVPLFEHLRFGDPAKAERLLSPFGTQAADALANRLDRRDMDDRELSLLLGIFRDNKDSRALDLAIGILKNRARTSRTLLASSLMFVCALMDESKEAALKVKPTGASALLRKLAFDRQNCDGDRIMALRGLERLEGGALKEEMRRIVKDRKERNPVRAQALINVAIHEKREDLIGWLEIMNLQTETYGETAFLALAQLLRAGRDEFLPDFVEHLFSPSAFRAFVRECPCPSEKMLRETMKRFSACADILGQAALGCKVTITKSESSLESNEYVSRRWFAYDLSGMDAAIESLCASPSPLAANLLHQIAKRRNARVVSYSETFQADRTDELDFRAQRERAAGGLTKRGNPAFDPSIYRRESIWTLSL